MQLEKIFLIDDEEIINAIQTRILKNEFPDTDIYRFNTAGEVLKMLPDLDYSPFIFLDLNMPEMDAIDFLKELDKMDLPNKPEIFILTFSQDSKELDFVNNHSLVKEVITKPLTQEKLEMLKDKYTLENHR